MCVCVCVCVCVCILYVCMYTSNVKFVVSRINNVIKPNCTELIKFKNMLCTILCVLFNNASHRTEPVGRLFATASVARLSKLHVPNFYVQYCTALMEQRLKKLKLTVKRANSFFPSLERRVTRRKTKKLDRIFIFLYSEFCVAV